jgi:hypothetical protein
VRPVGPAVASTQQNQGRAADTVTPLETDESTRSERVLARDPDVYYRRPPSARSDMLTARVPGTDLILGMSRRLFAACRSLAVEESQLLPVSWTGSPDLFADAPLDELDEDRADYRIRERREQFAYWAEEARGRLGRGCQKRPTHDGLCLRSTFKSTVKWRSDDLQITWMASRQAAYLRFWSGWRDSNPRPPAPKAGALTKLRHIP